MAPISCGQRDLVRTPRSAGGEAPHAAASKQRREASMPKQKRRHWNSVESRLHFARPYVDGFEKWLQNHGYTPSTIEEQVRLLAGWTNWMHSAGFALDNIMDGLTASVAVFKGKKSIRAYAGAGRLFIRYLQDQGTLPRPAISPSPAEQWRVPHLGVFRR